MVVIILADEIIQKCCEANCWYCTMNPKRLSGDIPLHWLPDLTKGKGGTFRLLMPFSEQTKQTKIALD